MSKEIIEGYRLLMEVEKDSKKRKLYQDIIDGYEIISELKSSSKNEDVLLAPNGKPSNLTPEQYKLVRTPEFKDWFGDWENSPETASKAVDENGEPKVLYHGGKKDSIGFTKFDTKIKDWRNVGDYVWKEFGSFFTDSYETAEYYAGLGKQWTNPVFEKYRGEIRPFFLNIRKPLVEKYDNEKWYYVIPKIFQKEGRNAPNRFVSKEYEPQNPKYDGFIISGIDEADVPNTTTYHIKKSNQAKLADGTNTTFYGHNLDIRFEDGGEVITEYEENTIKPLLLKSFNYLPNNLEFIGRGLNGCAFITEIDYELYVVKYTSSIAEYWLTQMAMVSNPPNVVTIKDVKQLSDNYEYGIIHKWVDRDGMPNKAVWNVAVGVKTKEYLEQQELVPTKERDYVKSLAKKLKEQVEDYFGVSMDVIQQNWGYEDGKLVLFDIDGYVKKNQYEEWMKKYANKYADGGDVNNYREFYEKLKIVDGSIFIGQKFSDVFPFLGRKKTPNDFRATMNQYEGILKRIEQNNYATKSMKQRDLNKLEKIQPNINNTEYLSRFYLDSQGTIINFK